MKKQLAVVLSGALLASLLSGMSAFAEEGVSDTLGSGDIHISLLSHQSRSNVGSSGFATGFYTALDLWASEHPEVTIDYESMDQTSYQTKINALGASGDMPDIFQLKGSWTNTFVDNGWVSDITPELEADPDWYNGYINNAFDNFTRDGVVYGVPNETMSTALVFYNSDLWSKIGYDEFPATWEELLEAIPKFEEIGVDTFVMGNKANWPAESDWLSTLGDRFTGVDWTNSILDGSGAKFTDESFVNALTCFQDLAAAGAFNEDINSIDDTEQYTYYYDQKAATIVTGTWFIPIVTSDAPEEVLNATKLAVLPAISGASEDQTTISGGPAWALSVSSNEMDEEKRALVIDLLKYLTDYHQADVTASMGGLTSWANPTYDSDAVAPLYNEYLELMKDKTTVPIYDACMEASVIETMNVGLQSLLIGDITPQDLAEQIQLQLEMLG